MLLRRHVLGVAKVELAPRLPKLAPLRLHPRVALQQRGRLVRGTRNVLLGACPAVVERPELQLCVGRRTVGRLGLVVESRHLLFG